jgi:hypothetical protein
MKLLLSLMPSRAKEASAESKEEEAEDSNIVMEDSNSVSSKPEDDDKQQKKGSTASATRFDSTSRSATASVVVRHPESQSGLPTFAAAAAAAAPQLEKGPRKAGLRDQFLPKVRSFENTTAACMSPSNSNDSFFIPSPSQRLSRNNSSE